MVRITISFILDQPLLLPLTKKSRPAGSTLFELIARNIVSVSWRIRIQAFKFLKFRTLLSPFPLSHCLIFRLPTSLLFPRRRSGGTRNYVQFDSFTWTCSNFKSASAKKTRKVLTSKNPQISIDFWIGFAPSRIPNVAEDLKQMTRECKPPSRSICLCDQLEVTIGVFRITTFEADGKGGYIIEQKSRLHADRSGAKLTGGASISP